MSQLEVGSQFELPRRRMVRYSDQDKDTDSYTQLNAREVYTIIRIHKDRVTLHSQVWHCGAYVGEETCIAKTKAQQILQKYRVSSDGQDEQASAVCYECCWYDANGQLTRKEQETDRIFALVRLKSFEKELRQKKLVPVRTYDTQELVVVKPENDDTGYSFVLTQISMDKKEK